MREDHTEPQPANVKNEVVSIRLDGSGEVKVLATGRDFYAHPRLSADGAFLSYIAWDHPNMPWDATELRLTSMAVSGSPDTETHTLIGGGDGDTSVLQPSWHPTSGALWFVSDASGWYNLYRVAAGGERAVCALPRAAEFGGASPGWALGQQGYAFLPDGRLAAHWVERSTGETTLTVLEDSDAPEVREFGSADGLPHSFGGLCPAPDGTLYMVGGSPASSGGVYAWRGLAGGAKRPTAPAAVELVAAASSTSLPEGVISTPRCIEFPTTLGTAFGYYYPPTNGDFSSDEDAPPLLVKALLTTSYFLLTTYDLLLTAPPLLVKALLTTYDLLLTTYYLLHLRCLSRRYLLLTTYYLLLTTYYLLLTTDYLLHLRCLSRRMAGPLEPPPRPSTPTSNSSHPGGLQCSTLTTAAARATGASTVGGCAARGGSWTLTTCVRGPRTSSSRALQTLSASASTAARRAGTRRWARSRLRMSSRPARASTVWQTSVLSRETRTSLKAVTSMA